jgi:hypothetical protein
LNQLIERKRVFVVVEHLRTRLDCSTKHVVASILSVQ